VELSGAEWCRVELSGAEWCRVVPSGAEWSRVVPSGAEWSRGEEHPIGLLANRLWGVRVQRRVIMG